MFGILAFVASDTFFMVVDPILPYKLSHEFGYQQHEIGIFFFHFTAAAVVITFLALLIPDSLLNKVFFIAIGCLLSGVGAFLTGPSSLLGLPN